MVGMSLRSLITCRSDCVLAYCRLYTDSPLERYFPLDRDETAQPRASD